MVMVLVGTSHHDVTLEELDRLAAADTGLARRLGSCWRNPVGHRGLKRPTLPTTPLPMASSVPTPSKDP